MLDMGFEAEVRRVVQDFNAPDKIQWQTLMFSTTFPEEIQKLAAEFLNDHVFLTVGVVGGAPSNIQQIIIEVTKREKSEKLQEILSAAGMIRCWYDMVHVCSLILAFSFYVFFPHSLCFCFVS